MFERIIENLASIHLAVVLFTAIVIASIYGSLMEDQARAVREVYHAPWFITLLAIFSTNLITCTIKRNAIRLQKASLLITHASIILILAGTIATGLFGIRGKLRLWERRAGINEKAYFMMEGEEATKPYGGVLDDSDLHLRGEGFVPQALGFTLRLDEFEVEYYPPPIIVMLHGEQSPSVFNVLEGERRTIGPYSLHVKKYFPNYVRREKILTASDQIRNPAWKTEVSTRDSHEKLDFWLMAQDEMRREFILTEPFLRISFSWFASREELGKAIGDALKPQSEKLIVSVEGKCRKEFPVELAVIRFIEGTPYAIKIERYEPDYASRNVPGKSEFSPDNPALKVKILKKSEDGTVQEETRWAFAHYPNWEKVHSVKFSDVCLTYIRPDSDLLKIFQAEDVPARILLIENEEVVLLEELDSSKTYEACQGEYLIKFYEFVPDAMVVIEESTEGNFPSNPVMQLSIGGTGAPVEMNLAAVDPRWKKYGNMRLRLADARSAGIKAFKSYVSILQNGEVVQKGIIEVNKPLTYGGYTFYQSTYDDEAHMWTGLEVVSDPGVPLVYAGFVLLSIGMVWNFCRRALGAREGICAGAKEVAQR